MPFSDVVAAAVLIAPFFFFSKQAICRDLFGPSLQLWNGGASVCLRNVLECVVQLDKDNRFVDVWMRCAPACLEQALKFADKVVVVCTVWFACLLSTLISPFSTVFSLRQTLGLLMDAKD